MSDEIIDQADVEVLPDAQSEGARALAIEQLREQCTAMALAIQECTAAGWDIVEAFEQATGVRVPPMVRPMIKILVRS